MGLYGAWRSPPAARPLDSPDELLGWTPGHSNDPCRASVTLRPQAGGGEGRGRPRLLACHDMAGGYGDDRFCQGGSHADFYCLRRWHSLDAFCYFSHRLVTIPPPGWINAAHAHGVPVLGTVITEWEAGAAACTRLFGSPAAAEAAAARLAAIARHYGFEGWLVNIENAVERQHIPHLLHFLRYDAVTTEGKLKWQNTLSRLNRPFFDACDAIWVNYTWKKGTPALVRLEAGERCADVFMGVDCFGRGTYGGGGFACDVALRACLEQGLSAALFATGWPYEGDCGADAPACWRQRDARFWACIESAWEGGSRASSSSPGSSAARGAIQELPLFTDFSVGSGHSMYQAGRQLSPQPWYNLSLQSLQPMLRVQLEDGEEDAGAAAAGSAGGSRRQSGSAGSSGSRVQADVSRELAYSRGSSLRLSGCLRPGQQATVQLFRTAVPLPAAGMRVRLCATPAQGVKQRLALRLAPGSSSSLDVSGGSIELLPAVRHSGTGTDDGAGVSAASSSSPSSALVLAASSEHVVQQQGSTAAAAGPDAAAAAAGPDAAAPWPQWVTRSYLIGADMLAAGLAGSGDPLLLTGVDVVLLGAGRAGDGSPAPFEVHLGELCIEEAFPNGGPPAPPSSVQQLACSDVRLVAAAPGPDGAPTSALSVRLTWHAPEDGLATRCCHVWCAFGGCGDEGAAPRWLGAACCCAYWLAGVPVPCGATAVTFMVQPEGCNGYAEEHSMAEQQTSVGKKVRGVGSLRSGFGEQPTSNRPSAPAAGFGSSSRDAYQKQFASTEVDKAQARSRGNIDNPLGACYAIPDTIEKQVLSTQPSPPRMRFGTGKRPSMAVKTDAPGPGAYKMRPAIGDTVESTRASAPRMKFGSGSRDQANRLFISSEHEKCQVGVDSPGPSYNLPAGMGRQQLSTKKSPGTFVMPKGQRFVDNDVREAAQKPGAGAYNVPSSIGGQADKAAVAASTLRNSPTIRFGTSTRDQDAKVFISQEHEKGSYGSCSPGPVTANPASSMGRQILSTRSSGACLGFGTGKRLVEHATDVPGPGAYYA
ncbi:hypothetical protein CHLNCDRAFT_53027 [Chlorella variabilis]|uniref:mannosyl-glycoprotein endo-beta-N-acetylglucosaminidase n=1 Tax=Chlorella variabilis TaxID=554065 RepID=E1ZHZ9_CHLVA|nr:hypothetical protein CHLNCDRAFT_53027 [Chlorella variabilis]EFN54696.1 hypothetical protein CHLNCDRAFT_53027 [Chlorella variabilis]|eukprot:XP_005846798.1 hypothetical protein CHLNCDRAFT_53027 [Chlorella variabilis]